MRGPGISSGVRIAENVGLVDLLPTALDLLGVAPPSGFQPSGNSLGPALRSETGATPDTPQYAESLVPLLHFGWSDLRVLRHGKWKYVLAPKPELYDLAADPHEQRNVADQQPAQAVAFRRTLANLLEQERRIGTTTAARTVPVELLERLGALGYVGGNSSAVTPSAIATSGADPEGQDPRISARQPGDA